MPVYEYRCSAGHDFERYAPLKEFDRLQNCECGLPGIKKPSRFIGVVYQDVCYDSPIDGRPITSRQARKEDMARHGCIEYDPEMRKDADRRMQESQAALDRKVEEAVESTIEAMPSQKRERLYAEMMGGADAAVIRSTVEG